MSEKKKTSVLLEYVGPLGAESPMFGVLVPGERYQCDDAEFAAYLCRQHPDTWRTPEPRKPAADAPLEA